MTVSPLHPPEDFCFLMYEQKRAQIAAWQAEVSLDVPAHLLDECNDWRLRWLAKARKEIAEDTGFNELAFSLQLKQFEKEWSEK